MKDIAEIKDKIHALLWHNIKVLGANNIMQTLETLRFFECPASTKYHGAYPGGLAEHSYAVTTNLLKLTERMNLNWQEKRSPIIVGILHDICKYDCYSYNEIEKKYEYRKDAWPGHGEKSVKIINDFFDINLTNEEAECIRWHMGAFDDKENWNKYGSAIETYPNVLWTHTADMMAARIDKT